jgi:hypothetical protein
VSIVTLWTHSYIEKYIFGYLRNFISAEGAQKEKSWEPLLYSTDKVISINRKKYKPLQIIDITNTNYFFIYFN